METEKIYQNPLNYGFRNVEHYCTEYKRYHGNNDWDTQNNPKCAFPIKEMFWWDNKHPSSHVHSYWADRMVEIMSGN
jgi:phospholipase/lecithinase/hemolysin